jgi:hypothetical protein
MRKLLSVAVLAGSGLALAAPAASAKAPPPSGATPGPVPSQDRRCTLSPSLTHSGGEFSSCISVGAWLSTAPAVGQRATLKVRVKAARSEPNTKVTIDLPPTLRFADGTATKPAVTGVGKVRRADAGTLTMAAGRTRSLTRVVKAVGTGFGEIAVSAADRLSAGRTDGGTDSVFTTIARTNASSRFGASGAVVGDRTGAVAPIARGAAPAPEVATPSNPTPLPPLKRPPTQVASADAAAPGTSCVTGTWNYVDQNSVTRPANDVVVEVHRTSDNALLASGFTSPSDASYNLCWSTGGATQTVSVKWIESNQVWTLVNLSNGQYTFGTGSTSIPDGTTHDFGGLQPADSTVMRGLHAYQEANDEYQWIYAFFPNIGGCWSPLQTTCQQLVIHWQADSTTGTFWNSTGAYLLAGSPDTLDEPVHEYGHALMYGLYGETFPATTNCSPHDLFVSSSTTCGWTEGWADWVATSVYNNTVWTYNGGFQRDLNVSWNEGLGYDTGDTTEARIAEAIRSLTDGVKGPWDNDPGEGSGIRDNTRWFHVLADFKPNTFAQVWSGRAADGYDVSQTALSALYQGTIDYGFRNPLSSTGRHFPEAVPDHNYSFAAPAGFWSVVAEKPDTGSDTDLTLFSDFNQTTSLGTSAFGGTATDFVAINSNSGHRPAQTYYPRVHQFAGSGGYTVQGVPGSSVLSLGSSVASFTNNQPVAIRDSFQNSGVPVSYRAVPGSSVDAQLCVTPAASDIVQRSVSTCGTDPGTGNAATLTYSPVSSGWHGLVLLDNSLTAGNVTVYADTTAPTGSVSIEGGAASTSHRRVSLDLSAADTQTGVDSMQISTDGTFDTEPVVPYSTSATTTLPAGNGTKTVYVRYQNNAGIWSDPVTDTIALRAIYVTDVTPSAGPLAGGNSVRINGAGFTGVKAVKFGTSPATSYTVVSPARIDAVAPRQAAGGVHIRVTRAGGTSPAKPASTYTYVAKPKVTKISPTSGPRAGGTTVTIKGANLRLAKAVRFGAKAAASFTVVSAKKITAVTPAAAAGAVPVRAVTPGGTATAATKFTYH